MSNVSAPTAPRVRGPSFFQGYFWTFWVKGVVLYRVTPIVLLTFLTYNVWGYSYWAWLASEYSAGKISGLFSGVSTDGRAVSVLLLLVGAILVCLWAFVLTKAWQGVGGRWYKGLLAGAPFGLFVWLLTETGIVPSGGSGFFIAIQATLGVFLGVCYSLNFIDRRLTGTIGTTQTDEDSHHSGDDGHSGNS